jgi:hypothetical protein
VLKRWRQPALMACAVLAAYGIFPAAGQTGASDVETEHMFGFTLGSDIGRPDEGEVEITTVGRFGRQGGAYSALSTTAEFKYPLSGAFRASASATVAHYRIAGVTDLDDRDQFTFSNFAAELDYRVLDRRSAPVGLTLIASPFYGFVDDVSGAPADRYGSDFVIAADRALVPGQLFVALNLVYSLERSRDYASGIISDNSTLGFQVGVAQRVRPWLYIGAEARYLRFYDGLGLESLAGQALYLGPTLYAPVTKGVLISAAWNVQAWGQANGGVPGIDLVNFEQQQALLRLEIDF